MMADEQNDDCRIYKCTISLKYRERHPQPFATIYFHFSQYIAISGVPVKLYQFSTYTLTHTHTLRLRRSKKKTNDTLFLNLLQASAIRNRDRVDWVRVRAVIVLFSAEQSAVTVREPSPHIMIYADIAYSLLHHTHIHTLAAGNRWFRSASISHTTSYNCTHKVSDHFGFKRQSNCLVTLRKSARTREILIQHDYDTTYRYMCTIVRSIHHSLHSDSPAQLRPFIVRSTRRSQSTTPTDCDSYRVRTIVHCLGLKCSTISK